jgi:hypothetical protein
MMIRKIEIGGQERPVCFNFNCLEEFEQITGSDPLNGLKINAKNAKALIFCGLKYGAHPEGCDNSALDFTLAKVGSWLDPATVSVVMEAFNSQGAPEGEKKTEAEHQLK